MLNQDIVSLIQKKRDFPSEFSARKIWMLVHNKYPNITIEEFSKKISNISKEKDGDYSNQEDQNDDFILEYVIDQRGVRLYSIMKSENEVLKSVDIVRKIKNAMSILNSSISINQKVNLNEEENFQSKNKTQTNNIFMTESEISQNIQINTERIRPFILILIEIGVIVVESIENERHEPTLHQKRLDSNLNLNVLESENPDQNDNIQDSIINACQDNNNDFLYGNNDFLNLHMINLDESLSTNDINNDCDNSKLDIGKNGASKKNMANSMLTSMSEMGSLDDKTQKSEGKNLSNGMNSKFKNISKFSSKRRIRWDENREMSRKNLSSTFEYLNKLRSMKNLLIDLISKIEDEI